MAIDMWSFGCMMIELYTGFPIFAGENEGEQLACMMEVKGIPPLDYIKVASLSKFPERTSLEEVLQL